jgi:DNA repair photolyase
MLRYWGGDNMALRKSKGNMYGFVSHTWNTIKGKCSHDCIYCYMKRWNNLKPARFDESELQTDLGSGNFIFVGSSNDLFSTHNPFEWISKTLHHCRKYPDNEYLFQTKNAQEMSFWLQYMPENSSVCITLESNRHYNNIMGDSPSPFIRALHFKGFTGLKRYITIEPILDFGVGAFVKMIKDCDPVQVNIGADSGNNNLPEPSPDKIKELITELSKFTKVHEKPNLQRLLK